MKLPMLEHRLEPIELGLSFRTDTVDNMIRDGEIHLHVYGYHVLRYIENALAAVLRAFFLTFLTAFAPSLLRPEDLPTDPLFAAVDFSCNRTTACDIMAVASLVPTKDRKEASQLETEHAA